MRWIFIVVAVSLCAACGLRQAPRPSSPTNGTPRNPTTAPVTPINGQKPAPPTGIETKLDGALIAITRGLGAAGIDAARAAAAGQKIPVEEDRVQVEIVCTSPEGVPAIGKLVVDAGGKVQTVFENRSYAWLPFSAVTKLAADDRVWSMAVVRTQLRPPESFPY